MPTDGGVTSGRGVGRTIGGVTVGIPVCGNKVGREKSYFCTKEPSKLSSVFMGQIFFKEILISRCFSKLFKLLTILKT